MVVVQNGIIENCRTLREKLQAEVVVCRSDTDMEVIPHLLSREPAGGRCRTILSKPLYRCQSTANAFFGCSIALRSQSCHLERGLAGKGPYRGSPC